MGIVRAFLPHFASKPSLRRVSRTGLLGGGLVAAGGAGAFLLMAHDAQLRMGIPLGALGVGVCTIGLMHVAAPFDDPASPGGSSVEGRKLAKPIAATLLSGLGVMLCLWAAVHSLLPQWLAGALLSATFIALLASLFASGVALGPLRLDDDGNPRHLLRRHGFWLLVVMALLYLPALGMGSLVDPWETHYGEVAREILARDDWISTWWSWEGFFYSKPVLGIWIQSIAMALLGVHVQPGQMLLESHGAFSHPEWAVRIPFVLFAMVGTYLLYKGASRWFGRGAALLGGLVLATCPHWFFLAHQSMTDMPYVAALAGAMGLFLYAVREEDATLATTWEVTFGKRAIRLHAWHLVFGAILATLVPQILYLVSRNVELVLHASGAHGFRPHLDEFAAGSGLGNCNQPGDPACAAQSPVSHFEPWMQALMWTGGLVLLLVVSAGERRTKRLAYLAAWLLAAVATMAKGPAGLGIPMACVGVWVAISGRWDEVPRTALGAGLLVVVLLVGPWTVAMVVRHGSSFTDELFFHDIFNRAFDHVHDTNAGVDTGVVYYVGQLGYGLFPWIALVPAGLTACCARGEGEKDTARDGALLLLSWFGVAFALFTFMGTKFHHYIAPAVPPLAMLVGLALHRSLEKSDPGRPAAVHARLMTGAACLAGALLVLLSTRDLIEGPARLMQLFTYRYDRPWPPSIDWPRPLAITGGLACVCAVMLAVPRTRKWAVGAWVVLAVGWAAWGLDVYLPGASPHWGQRAVIEAYYADRTGPGDPLVAYDLNWKGENFYTSNRIAQFGTPTVPPDTPKLAAWLGEEKSKGQTVLYFVTEHNRVAGLRKELAAKNFREVTTRADSNQFVLVRADL